MLIVCKGGKEVKDAKKNDSTIVVANAKHCIDNAGSYRICLINVQIPSHGIGLLVRLDLQSIHYLDNVFGTEKWCQYGTKAVSPGKPPFFNG